jgi:putative membrane protein
MKRKINPEALLRLCILFGLSALLLISLISGKAQEYVNPRINIYLWIAAFGLTGAGVCMLPGLFKLRHHPRIAPYIVILAVVFGSFALPTATVQNNAVSFQTIGSAVKVNKSIDQAKINVPVASGLETQNDASAVQTASQTPDVSNSDENEISVLDEGFGDWYADIKQNPNKYEGKTVKVKGQVYRIPDLEKNEFIPVRMDMICCSADLIPLGFLCRYDNAKELTDDEWVWVTAVIKIEDYKGSKMPILYATNVTPAEKPVNEYVFLF